MISDLPALEHFVVQAKARCHVGKSKPAPASRDGSHDLVHADGPWMYRDSYFGGTDFLGQEVVWFEDEPVWAMNYYGAIIAPALIDAHRAGATIKDALSAMYREGRFLGGFTWQGAFGVYIDRSRGTVARFRGVEVIRVEGTCAYQLDYAGGLIKP